MIKRGSSKGYILPVAILLSASLFVLINLLVEQSSHAYRQAQVRLVHKRTIQALRLNVHSVIEQINRIYSRQPSTTYVKRLGNSQIPRLKTDVVLEENQTHFLGSENQETTTNSIIFQSPLSENQYISDPIILPPGGTSFPMSFAWVVEDIPLTAPATSPPPWWPVPVWQCSPVAASRADEDLFTLLSGKTKDTIQLLAKDEPIPFDQQNSPAFVPVVCSIRLRFGLFASGNISQREKMVRVRYFLECELWNPYNRDMQFHAKSGLQPVFQLLFRHLPLLRITNLSKGNSTGWIPMDELYNPQTGETGIHGWIRLPGKLTPGQSITAREPDRILQPEGLARIVHTSFMISQADSIQVEFKANERGMEAACASLETNNPVEQVISEDSWFSVIGSAIELPELVFARADDPGHPFYLVGGSLSFREEIAQIEIEATREIQKTSIYLDPRQRHISSVDQYMDATGQLIAGADLMQIRVKNLIQQEFEKSSELTLPPLLSWPAGSASSLFSLTDIPDWNNAYCLGVAGASAHNYLLDAIWPAPPARVISRQLSDGNETHFEPSLPVNSISPTAWLQFLKGDEQDTDRQGFALFANPVNESDHITIDQPLFTTASGRLALFAQATPSRSVGDFFNRGVLTRAFNFNSANPQYSFLQLRGIVDKGRLVNHGSAVIVHAACITDYNDLKITKSVRIWLLKVPQPSGETAFRIIYHEPTDPLQHVTILSNPELQL